ncbi:MAG: BON domain-containing protein [Gemmatimonadales bacterium]|nr:BON domain-containing protein [Gemmatimonadales bacterium]
MRQQTRLSGSNVLLWATLGVGTGMVAAFALSEWVGGVNPPRVRGAARRLREATHQRPTTAAAVRVVETALRADPRLASLGIEVVPVRRCVVELRGWVPSRVARTIAGRVALACPGVESVINSILVRGEDDRAVEDGHATDQSA